MRSKHIYHFKYFVIVNTSKYSVQEASPTHVLEQGPVTITVQGMLPAQAPRAATALPSVYWEMECAWYIVKSSASEYQGDWDAERSRIPPQAHTVAL